MRNEDWHDRIDDMLECAQRVAGYVRGLDAERFQTSPLIVDAVCRNLEIFGEAANYIPDEIKELAPEIAWGDIRGMRNILAHGYMKLDLDRVWFAATSSMPASVNWLAKLKMFRN